MAFQRSGFQQSVSVTKDCWELEPAFHPLHPPPPPPPPPFPLHCCKYSAAHMGTHAQRPARKSLRKKVLVFAPAQITRHSTAQERIQDSRLPICPDAWNIRSFYLPGVCVAVRACGNLWFTEGSRNVISSHLLWYGHQGSIYTRNAPARAGMHFTVSVFRRSR